MEEQPSLLPLPDRTGQQDSLAPVTWVTITDVSRLLHDAGIARNKRSIRRYCERGDLDCRKTENALHQPQYFIDAASVEIYIAQQKTLMAASPDVPGLDRAEPEESGHDHVEAFESSGAIVPAFDSGHDRTSPDQAGLRRSAGGEEVFVELRARLEDKDAEIAFLRGELLHRRTTDTALHDVIAAFRANAEAQRLAAAPVRDGQGTSGEQPYA